MLVSHECPISLLEDSRKFNDYDYALVHLFEQERDYLNFFKESVKRGRTVYLDNSIFELEEAFDSDRFAYWVNELSPTHYIIPDALENKDKTIRLFEEWNKKYKNNRGLKIGVVQGKTWDELVECYKYMSKNADMIAINFGCSVFGKIHKFGNKWARHAMGRVEFIYSLVRDRVWDFNKPHHLLGCSLPIEFIAYKNLKNIISVDTSNPIVHGIMNIRYSEYGLFEKQNIKLVEFINAHLNDSQLRDVYFNIKRFKEFI